MIFSNVDRTELIMKLKRDSNKIIIPVCSSSRPERNGEDELSRYAEEKYDHYLAQFGCIQ